MPTITIATASQTIRPNVRLNRLEIAELMSRAKDEGARLVHFCEGALSGYVGSEIDAWDQVDWSALREEVLEIAELARRFQVWVVFGSNHPLTPPNRPHDSLYVVSDAGRIVERYDKRYCSYNEISNWYSPGFTPITFEVDGYRFGILSCIEIQFHELFLEYAELGVDCILLSAYARDPKFRLLARAHAALTCTWVSLATPAQYATSLRSAVFGPDGSTLMAAPRHQTTCIVTTALDRNDARFEIALTKARPWRAKARLGNVYAAKRVHDPRSLDKQTP
jgi:predicted amidohydrolase